MTHYIYIEDSITRNGLMTVKDFGTDKEKAISKAESEVGRLTRNEFMATDSIELLACEITDEEIAAIENGETDKSYGDYCTEIVRDLKKTNPIYEADCDVYFLDFKLVYGPGNNYAWFRTSIVHHDPYVFADKIVADLHSKGITRIALIGHHSKTNENMTLREWR